MTTKRTITGLAAILGACLVPLTALTAELPAVLEELGAYERRAVQRVLERRGWEIAPNPDAKSIDEIHVVPLPVFSERDGDTLQWFNRLHVTSQPDVIRRDVLLEPGDRWNPEEARETERNLRDRTYPVLALAVVVPIRTANPEIIDVLV
ncbi:MAG: hypothetical protein ABEN55_04425, partial [Bradymonadaceae bacterium]